MTQAELNQKAVDEIRVYCSTFLCGKNSIPSGWAIANEVLDILKRNSLQAKEADRG